MNRNPIQRDANSVDLRLNYREVNSVDFAIYLSHKAAERGLQVNATKIQKWMYLCYGVYLVLHRKQMLTERPKACAYGPVFARVQDVQNKHRVRNKNCLCDLICKTDLSVMAGFDEVIDRVFEKTGHWTADQMINWTHQKGMAWHRMYHLEGKQAPMDNLDILNDFEKLFDDD